MTSWPWPRAKKTLLSVLALARHEFRMTLRERAGWGGLIAACALAFADAALKPHLPIVGGIRASLFGGPLVLAPLAIVFVAGAARRDEAVSATDVIGSRPYPRHTLFLARFVGNYALTVLGYALVIVASLLPALVFGGKFASPLTVMHAFVRGIVPLLHITALAYCAVTLARNVLAAAVVAVYWLFVLLWGDFLARIFNFSLTQNWPSYAALALGVVLGTMALRRRAEGIDRGRRWGKLLPTAALVLLALGVLDAWNRVAHSHDKPLHRDPLALTVAGQHLEASPRLPGLWLRDQHGRLFRMSQADDRVVAVAFWSPHVAASVPALDVLREVSTKFPAEQVVCIAVCLSNDHAISPHVAPEGRYNFPMVADTGTHYAGKVEECAPVGEAYILTEFPTVFVADRGRRLVATITAGNLRDAEPLKAAINQALATPVPPS